MHISSVHLVFQIPALLSLLSPIEKISMKSFIVKFRTYISEYTKKLKKCFATASGPLELLDHYVTHFIILLFLKPLTAKSLKL